MSFDPPSWPHCGHGATEDERLGCRGRRIAPYSRCLAHLTEAARADRLGTLRPGADVDYSGTRFTPDLLQEVLSPLRGADEVARFGWATFRHAVFESHTSFYGACFRSGARFDAAAFGDDVLFKRTVFGASAWFSETSFGENAGFTFAEFGDGAMFHHASFKGRARFRGTRSGADTSFESARFEGRAFFADAAFGDRTSFEGVAFAERATFTGAAFDLCARPRHRPGRGAGSTRRRCL